VESVSERHAKCRDEARHGRPKCLRHDNSLAISVTYKLHQTSDIGRKRCPQPIVGAESCVVELDKPERREQAAETAIANMSAVTTM